LFASEFVGQVEQVAEPVVALYVLPGAEQCQRSHREYKHAPRHLLQPGRPSVEFICW